MIVHLFDFDGTITTHDTMLALARFRKGRLRLVLFFLLYMPWLVAMKLGLYSNQRMKERFLRHFFGRMSVHRFGQLCQQFAEAHIQLVRPRALRCIAQANERHEPVVIISASCVEWVRPMMQQFDVQVHIIGSELETADGRLTGRLSGNNCYGAEKVHRAQEYIAQLSPQPSSLKTIAYGDSRGDKELLAYADESHYKPFR